MTSKHHPIVGSWRIDLYPDEQLTVNRALAAFMSDGILIASPPPVESFPLTDEGTIDVATALGAWTVDGEREFELGFVGQATTSKSVLVGFASVRASGRVDEDGNTWSGRYHFEIAGSDEAVFATENGSVRAIRIQASSPERARYLPTAVAASGNESRQF